jgi:hypothetical protein
MAQKQLLDRRRPAHATHLVGVEEGRLPRLVLHGLDPRLPRLRLLAVDHVHERLELRGVALCRALGDVKRLAALVQGERRR